MTHKKKIRRKKHTPHDTRSRTKNIGTRAAIEGDPPHGSVWARAKQQRYRQSGKWSSQFHEDVLAEGIAHRNQRKEDTCPFYGQDSIFLPCQPFIYLTIVKLPPSPFLLSDDELRECCFSFTPSTWLNGVREREMEMRIDFFCSTNSINCWI